MTKKIRQWHLHARHIVSAIDEITEFQTRGAIETDKLVYAGTLRNLHMVSESTGHIPDAIKEDYPQTNWKIIKAFRNFIVHDYLGDNVDIEIIKKILNKELPELKSIVQHMLEKYPDGNGAAARKV